ncbi:MarR family winged helix-turn-helix transcriptional regulator [Arthrobacter castelli]|uniref:MarR family winged helix-turn-helix transcriptional regulator n=1 Tax=Arthrobacter castelli TaxID=271431 RepID=UPI00041FB723|nr:MarR family transcriptional regulator [Arthrobacter castelli]
MHDSTLDGGAQRERVLEDVSDSSRLLSTAMVLFHTNLSSKVGLGPTDEKVLELVRRDGSPSPRDLAEYTGLARNSITDVLDRLSRRGFIARSRDAGDGRIVRVRVTEEGAARIGGYLMGLMTRVSELNTDYTVDELRLIAQYQRRAAAIQETEARKLLTDDTSGKT